MSKSIIISERDNIAAVMENNKVVEFFINRGDMLLGDVYLAYVENILPSIDAAFVNLGGDRMGFLHASDIPGKGPLKDRLKPKQQLLVQIIKEPTGHKGPRVTTALSLPGRFLVLMPDEKGVSVSRKIVSPKERARLKSVVSLIKPAGVGVIIRTEAENQAESEIQEDIELLLERWNNIVAAADTVTPPNLLYRDQDILYRVIREACTEEINEIVLDTPFAVHRATQLLQSWNMGQGIKVVAHKGNDSILTSKGVDKEIRAALQTKVIMQNGGYLYIQTTEALTVVDVNSGKFTSSATQGETIRKTNLEAVKEIARQLKLRNIGGMIIIDFIDMENRVDQLLVLEELELALEPDKAKPQVGQLSDLGLVELTRHRQGQSLSEMFTKKCPACSGTGSVIEDFNFAANPVDGDFRASNNKNPKLRMPQNLNRVRPNTNVNSNNVATSSNINNTNANNILPRQNVEIKQVVNADDKLNQQRKLKTFPAASTAQRINRPEKPVVEATPVIDLTEESIKQFLGTKGYLPNISKIVKFSAVPPKVARYQMPESFIVDVFTVLQELENFENSPKPVIELSSDNVKKPERTENEKREGNFRHTPIKADVAVIEKVEPKTVIADNEEFEQKTLIEVEIPDEIEVVAEKLEAQISEENTSIAEAQEESLVFEANQIINEPINEQLSVIPVEADEEKKEETPKVQVKKPIRRGRKPKSDISKPATARRRTTTPSPETKE